MSYEGIYDGIYAVDPRFGPDTEHLEPKVTFVLRDNLVDTVNVYLDKRKKEHKFEDNQRMRYLIDEAHCLYVFDSFEDADKYLFEHFNYDKIHPNVLNTRNKDYYRYYREYIVDVLLKY